MKRGRHGEGGGNEDGNGNGGRGRHGVGKGTSSHGRRSFPRRARNRVKAHTNQTLSSASDSLGRRTEATAGAEGTEMDGEKETLLSLFFQPRSGYGSPSRSPSQIYTKARIKAEGIFG
ncbi:hypothetical protein I314_01421 [Cryptococcus bacillisporus CA1873]|uniref:Uncharacterized protein n=1 Tax=Cryptococcus bacillisporus CA1873 TaxID=1296111 RepID=A0ABR5BFJ5_CRYGA|nr:hypothetical protein I314_01421 [Cryptococcus bacillisporus CA1873]|eukprot:KIR67929.1 hypothetical protein I314_01421 [Cryptococcus gattii CA1873]